jgi:hypothetical protein
MNMKLNGEPFFSVPYPNICRILCTFLVFAVFFSTLTAKAQENQQILISPEEIAKSLDDELANNSTELEALKVGMKALVDLGDKVRTEIKTYDLQSTTQSQLLLTFQPRIENLENAIRNNRFAIRALRRYAETIQNGLDSTSILLQQTIESIELGEDQIVDLQESQLSDTWKSTLETTRKSIIKILDEKKQFYEHMLTTGNDLLDLINAALEQHKTLGEKLTVKLENEKKASVFNRFNSFGELSGEAVKKELALFWNRIRSGFSTTTLKVSGQRSK